MCDGGSFSLGNVHDSCCDHGVLLCGFELLLGVLLLFTTIHAQA